MLFQVHQRKELIVRITIAKDGAGNHELDVANVRRRHSLRCRISNQLFEFLDAAVSIRGFRIGHFQPANAMQIGELPIIARDFISARRVALLPLQPRAGSRFITLALAILSTTEGAVALIPNALKLTSQRKHAARWVSKRVLLHLDAGGNERHRAMNANILAHPLEVITLATFKHHARAEHRHVRRMIEHSILQIVERQHLHPVATDAFNVALAK